MIECRSGMDVPSHAGLRLAVPLAQASPSPASVSITLGQFIIASFRIAGSVTRSLWSCCVVPAPKQLGAELLPDPFPPNRLGAAATPGPADSGRTCA